jgi:hypothetical protein
MLFGSPAVRQSGSPHVLHVAAHARHHRPAEALHPLHDASVDPADAGGLELLVLGHLLDPGRRFDRSADHLDRDIHRLLVHPQLAL